jgi:hypothetical protein
MRDFDTGFLIFGMGDMAGRAKSSHVPLKIIRPWISVITVWTKGTDVSGGIVNEAMPNHFVLSLETFPSLASRTSLNRAVMWTGRRMNIGVRI